MEKIQTYQCPACGGAIVFDSSSQKMKCPYCDSEYDVSFFESPMGKTEPISPTFKDEETLRVYQCQTCGGEIIADKTTGASSCPFCGNAVVMTEQFANDLKPDWVIPFKLDKKAAKEGLKKHLQDKKLLPQLFKEEKVIDEIKGVYVPFWLFDASVDADARFHATKKRIINRGEETIVETNHYEVWRSGTIDFKKVPVDASSKVDKELMDSLEPFDVSQAIDFNTAYLAGYLADRYDLSKESCQEQVDQRMDHSMRKALHYTVLGYDSIALESCQFHKDNRQAHYVLYPVWLLNLTWKKQKFRFAMNGQTGKFVGDLPMDKKKYWLGFMVWMGLGTLITYVILFLTMGG